MPKRSGTASNSNAPVESTITLLSTGAGGILIGTDPVAMIIFFARYFSLFPLASKTETSLLPKLCQYHLTNLLYLRQISL